MRQVAAPAPPPLKQRIDSVTRFLQEFEKPDFWFARWEKHNGGFQVCILHPLAEEFLTALLRNEWVIPRRWPEWRDEARRIRQNPELLDDATAETITCILSAHVLADRINEGHLLKLYEEGHLQAILNRLERIGSEL
jgi:hypothetical protein